MKKFLLIFLCFYLFTSCSSTQKSNTLVSVYIDGTEVETLPIAADLAVLEQKVRGEAIGNVTDFNGLVQEAKTKALGQEPPSVDKPDVLVGSNLFTEAYGTDLKVIITGYPAYYVNFRTATKEDSLYLDMVKSDASPIEHKSSSKSSDKWYFSGRYLFGDGFGFGIGFGMEMSNGFFIGVEGDQGGFFNDDRYKGAGGGLTLGGIYNGLPYDLQLVFGSSIGFWTKEKSYYDGFWGGYETSHYYHVLAPFIKLRWRGLETGLQLFAIPDTDMYFTVGFTF